MKKIISLLFAIICLTACINPNTKNVRKSIEEQMNEEKKTQVEEKTKETKYGKLFIKSITKDVRTPKEFLTGSVPPKYNIINTVSLQGEKKHVGDLIFIPNIEIKKIIKHDLSNIDFVLMIKITTEKEIKLQDVQSVDIKSRNNILNLNTKVSYEPFHVKGYNFLHNIICSTNMSIDHINELRKTKEDSSIILTSNGRDFSFYIPKEFFEFLSEI